MFSMFFCMVPPNHPLKHVAVLLGPLPILGGYARFMRRPNLNTRRYEEGGGLHVQHIRTSDVTQHAAEPGSPMRYGSCPYPSSGSMSMSPFAWRQSNSKVCHHQVLVVEYFVRWFGAFGWLGGFEFARFGLVFGRLRL